MIGVPLFSLHEVKSDSKSSHCNDLTMMLGDTKIDIRCKVILFLLAQINIKFIQNKIMEEVILFIVIALVATCIEYISGLVLIIRTARNNKFYKNTVYWEIGTGIGTNIDTA